MSSSSGLGGLTGTEVTSLDDLMDFFGNTDNWMNSAYAQETFVPYAQSNWQLFVFFLSFIFFWIFFVLMLIAWIYIFIGKVCSCLYCVITKCLCCCCFSKKKKDDTTASDLRSSISPSNAAYVGGSPTSGSPRAIVVNGGGGSPRVLTASEKIGNMHKKELAKRDSGASGKVVPPKRRCLCCISICPLITFIIMGLVVGFVFLKSGQMDASVMNLLEDTDEFTKSTSQFLCTDGDPSWQCKSDSLGQFVKNSKHIFSDVSDEVINFIDDFSDDMSDSLDNTTTTLNNILTEMGTIGPKLGHISDNMTSLGKIYNAIPNTDDIELPTIETSMMDEYTESVNASITTINQINNMFGDMIDESLGSVKEMFTPGGNDSVVDIANGFLDQGISYIYKAQNYTVYSEQLINVMLEDGTIADLEDVTVGDSIGGADILSMIPIEAAQDFATEMTIEESLKYKTWALVAVFGVPTLVLLLTVLFNYCCFKRGCRVQLFCNMLVSFLFMFVVFIFTIMWAFFGVFMKITCDYHDDVIALIPSTNYSIALGEDTIQLEIGSQLVENILHCSDEYKNDDTIYSDSDNFISILGLDDDLVLVNDTLQAYRGNITQMLDALPTDDIDTAKEAITNISIASVFTMIGDYIALTDEITSNLTDITNALPSSTDIDDENVRIAWNESFYQYTYPDFWAQYTYALDVVNDKLASATALDASLQETFSYKNILLLPEGYFGDDTCYCEGTCTATCTTDAAYAGGAADYVALDQAGEGLYTLAEAFNVTVATRDELIVNITAMVEYSADITMYLVKINDSLNTVEDYITELGGNVDAISDTVDGISPGVGAVVDELMNLVDLVANLPAYMKCYFIADFYSNAFEGVVCNEFTPSLVWGSWSMLLFMFALMLSFTVSACCVRAKHIVEDVDDEDDDEDDVSLIDDEFDDGVQMISPTHSRELSIKSNQSRPVSLAL